MIRLLIASVLVAGVSLVAGPADAQQKASADVVDATGKKMGEAILEQRDDSVQIRATFTGLPPGEHSRDRKVRPPVRVGRRALQSDR